MTTILKPKTQLERVHAAFSPKDLIRICSQQDFSMYAPRIDLEDKPASKWSMWRGAQVDRFFYYRDRGAKILAVAHLDHVQADSTCEVVDTADGLLALSGALDDRLGAYVILELLPKLGVEVDWLLTTNEEMGASTASDFMVEHKQYNWMIEFDRGGTDVVAYQYENDALSDLVKAAGAKMGVGSYSDIADLEQLGCVGLNWGVGYYDYHSRRSHAWLNDTLLMVERFLRFYDANADTPLPYEDTYEVGTLRRNSAIDPDWLTDEVCPDCRTDWLDRWGCCWSCGFDVDPPLGG